MLKILKPQAHDKAYDFAAKEFQRLYLEITGIEIPITNSFNKKDDFIIIGSDAVNNYVFKMREEKIFSGLSIKYGSDDYQILSIKDSDKNYLLFAGGRGRSTIYAVYDFFERQAECRYYWDGDVIPKRTEISIKNLNILAQPTLEYRGLRYFAHRSLHRFQAEHWNYEDWKKEINWILKKRLNMFMLRIALDDIFQKTFPETVDYPKANGRLEENNVEGYDDRTTFWSLQYRGKLRKKILDYAFDCDLMHPDDIGPITHWYSRTPQQFLDKYKPDFMAQRTNTYAEQSGLVWDIRKQRNLDNYFKLAETHVKEYGKGELFHIIGLAERFVHDEREKNMELKCLAYRQVSAYLREHYPSAPLLLASWDFWISWTPEELEALCNQMDPTQAIILDYTTDAVDSSYVDQGKTYETVNFTKWRKSQSFPWIAGIFQAYEPGTEIKNDYNFVQKRLSKAFSDPNCRGLIYWPECSHTDSLMIEYFTSCAWHGKGMNIEDVLTDFCKARYGKQSQKMLKIWHELQPLSSLGSWGRTEFFFVFNADWFEESNLERLKKWERLQKDAEKLTDTASKILNSLASVKSENNSFLSRDILDIARTAIARHISLGILNIIKKLDKWRKDKSEKLKNELIKQRKYLLELLDLLADLLGTTEEYSLYYSLEKMRSTAPVNKEFEQTLKTNANNNYCRSYIYELVKYLYVPEMEKSLESFDSQLNNPEHDSELTCKKFEEAKEKINEKFKQTPLKKMAPKVNQDDLLGILKKAAKLCNELKIK
jgi:hypothetical protein